jgi:hypothetical protein
MDTHHGETLYLVVVHKYYQIHAFVVYMTHLHDRELRDQIVQIEDLRYHHLILTKTSIRPASLLCQ